MSNCRCNDGGAGGAPSPGCPAVPLAQFVLLSLPAGQGSLALFYNGGVSDPSPAIADADALVAWLDSLPLPGKQGHFSTDGTDVQVPRVNGSCAMFVGFAGAGRSAELCSPLPLSAFAPPLPLAANSVRLHFSGGQSGLNPGIISDVPTLLNWLNEAIITTPLATAGGSFQFVDMGEGGLAVVPPPFAGQCGAVVR